MRALGRLPVETRGVKDQNERSTGEEVKLRDESGIEKEYIECERRGEGTGRRGEIEISISEG